MRERGHRGRMRSRPAQQPGARSGGAARPGPLRRAGRAFRRAWSHAWARFREVGLWERALGFAALGFLTLVPLLIVVSAADPASGRGFAQWLGDGLGVSATARGDIAQLFAEPGQVRRATTAFGLAVLAVFGLSFGQLVQSGYEKVWDLPPAHWRARWRQVVWLAALIGVLFLSANSPVWRDAPARGVVTTLAGTLFFWWSQRMLLGGRVAWGALLPGSVATMLGLLGLRLFSRFVFSPLIASGAVAYGVFGTVLVVQSWLVGVGVVVFGGALAGALLHDPVPLAAATPPRHP
ncbi:ribonuclease BN [Streptomyces sp. NPDC051079]|uniref:ribonuclease BN n=1 Tax=unclassified Streptomyces TaxID=2593676 RepID=UPI00344FFA27